MCTATSSSPCSSDAAATVRFRNRDGKEVQAAAASIAQTTSHSNSRTGPRSSCDNNGTKGMAPAPSPAPAPRLQLWQWRRRRAPKRRHRRQWRRRQRGRRRRRNRTTLPNPRFHLLPQVRKRRRRQPGGQFPHQYEPQHRLPTTRGRPDLNRHCFHRRSAGADDAEPATPPPSPAAVGALAAGRLTGAGRVDVKLPRSKIAAAEPAAAAVSGAAAERDTSGDHPEKAAKRRARATGRASTRPPGTISMSGSPPAAAAGTRRRVAAVAAARGKDMDRPEGAPSETSAAGGPRGASPALDRPSEEPRAVDGPGPSGRGRASA